MNWRKRPTVTKYLSRLKLLTVAGLASPVGPPSAAGPIPPKSYVRKYVPPVTSKLVQQLSVPLPPGPQLVIPGPPGAQLGGAPASPASSATAPSPLASALASALGTQIPFRQISFSQIPFSQIPDGQMTPLPPQLFG